MSGKSIGLSFNYGYAGNVSRTPDCVIAAFPVADDSDNIPFGHAVVLNANSTYDAATSTTITATNFAGVAVAEVKQLNTYSTTIDSDQAGQYLPEQACDVLKRGVISVKCQRGTPANLGTVYVRHAVDSLEPDLVVGGFEASSDPGYNTALPNCAWYSNRVDANGITELLIKTINN